MTPNWPAIETSIHASGSDTHLILNEHRDCMLALLAWFRSQDIDPAQAAVTMATLLGITVGAKANSFPDIFNGAEKIASAVLVNALAEFSRSGK
jgi:hypothetical protein